jgi:RHS repeat-associated protein
MKKDCEELTYFYDGSLLLAEKVGNQIQKIYINDGQGIVGMVRPIYDGSNNLTHYQRLYYLYDSLGSVSAVTGENGLPLQNYTYSPFGTCLNVTGDPINNLQFVGRYGGYLDNDTGLTYFWHRWYDSKDGRWISRDPIGVKGGINLYNYVNNNSPNITDSTGNYWVKIPNIVACQEILYLDGVGYKNPYYNPRACDCNGCEFWKWVPDKFPENIINRLFPKCDFKSPKPTGDTMGIKG